MTNVTLGLLQNTNDGICWHYTFILFVHMDIDYIMLDYDFDSKLCLCTRLLGRAQFKPWGVKKNSVPYMTEIVLTNVLV